MPPPELQFLRNENLAHPDKRREARRNHVFAAADLGESCLDFFRISVISAFLQHTVFK